MRWLIVEDALRDRKGHWFEYLGTFVRELPALGDEVTLLADGEAEAFLVEQLGAKPVLPPSIWHRMGDSAGALRRYGRVPGHGWKTYRALRKFLSANKDYDIIFVPTVLVHHFLGWTALIKRVLKKSRARVLLFFPNTPVRLVGEAGKPEWETAPTAKLFSMLVRSLRKEVEAGRVILGVETEPMRRALTQLSGVPFTYFPHPVQSPQDGAKPDASGETRITMGSYGGARHEKGCDILVQAVKEYCRRHPETKARFVLQSVGGDPKLWSQLEQNPKVRLIADYFRNGDYNHHLAETDVLLLPYRRSSYGLRVSRVVIEAMVHGIPVVTTRGTTLEDQAKEFGAAVPFEGDSVEDLVAAIETMEKNLATYKAEAGARKQAARGHFSVREFRRLTGLPPHQAKS